MKSHRLLFFLACLTAILVAAIYLDIWPALRGPGPFPEWHWRYFAKPTLDRLLPAVVTFGILLVGLAAAGRVRRQAAHLALRWVAVGLGLGLQWTLLSLELPGSAETLIQRTEDPLFTSHHSVAKSPTVADPRRFLETHAELLPKLAVWAPHAATHPPGPTLFYRGLISFTRGSPWWRERLGSFTSRPATPETTAALAGALLLGLLGAATAVPLASLAGALGSGAPAATRVAFLWGLVPGVSLMVPELDQALALPVATSVVLVERGVRTNGLGGLLRTSLGGIVAAVGAFFSYGVPVFIAIGLAGVVFAHPTRLNDPARVAALATTFIAGFALIFGLPCLWGQAPIAGALTGLKIHREAYSQPRNYWTWLLFNPVDFLIFLGPPAALLSARSLRSDSLRSDSARALTGFARGCWLAALLWLTSGIVRGEVGRIAIPVFALLLVPCLTKRDSLGLAMGLALALFVLDVTLRIHWQLP